MTQRNDAAYVGIIDSRFIPMVRMEDDYMYYLPITSSNDQLALSAGAFSEGLTSSSVPIVEFEVESVEDGWTFQLYDVSGTSLGYLTITEDILSIGPEASTFMIRTSDPNGYRSSNLLASVRYQIYIPGTELFVTVNNSTDIDDDSDIGGLHEDIDGTNLVELSSTYWTLAPSNVTNIINGGSPPSTSGAIPGTVITTQCIGMDETGYGDGAYCIDWTQFRGFTTSEDVQPIIYYYSDNNNCGRSFTFNNDYLGQSVDVTSSIGSCPELSCRYDGTEFVCEEDRMLNWMMIALIIIATIFLIVIVIIIIAYLAYKKDDNIEVSVVQSPTENVI